MMSIWRRLNPVAAGGGGCTQKLIQSLSQQCAAPEGCHLARRHYLLLCRPALPSAAPFSGVSGARSIASSARAGSMLDSLKGMVGMKNTTSPMGAAAADALGGDGEFGIEAFSELAKKAKQESPEAQGMLAQLQLSAEQIGAVVDSMSAKDKADPGMLRSPDWRRVAKQASEAAGVAVSLNNVRDLIHFHGMLRIVMQRVNRAMLTGGAKAPTTAKEYTDIVKLTQKNITKAEMLAEAKALNGAFPANQPCPCGSTKKYKRCCSPPGLS